MKHGEPDDDDSFPGDMEPPELLMEATVRVLAEEGLEGLTLRKVADTAGKNRGLVHYYFESKADLLASLLDHIQEGTSRLIGLDRADTLAEQLWIALRFHAYGTGGDDLAGRHYYLAILQLQALAAHDPDIRERATRNHAFVVDLVEEIIDEGIARGVFHPVDAESMAVFLVSAVDGARTTALSTDAEDIRGSVLEELETWVVSRLVV